MSYQQVTLAQLQALLAARYESVPFWTTDESTTAINEALRLWNMLTGYWKRKAVVSTSAGNHWLNVDSTLLYQLRMTWEDYPMELSSLGDLDNARSGWEADTVGGTRSDGETLPNRPFVFAPAGLNLFAIWPADATTHQITVDSIRETPVLSAPTDFVDIGQEELHAILGYALHYLAFKEGGARFAATQDLYKQFISAAALKNGKLNASTYFRNVMGLDLNRKQRPMEMPLEKDQPAGGPNAG